VSLKDLKLKGLYDSDRDDLLNDFYIPVLSESIVYRRIAGFFSSNALAIAARGISKFIENDGKIQLIANVILSEKDQEAIRKAIEEKESKLINEIENMEDVLKKGHMQLLAWMIKNDKLEIKIAVVPKSIEHKKKGIFEDNEGNIISFSGSDNETVKGWLENDEEFHVFCSWIEGDKNRHLEPDKDAFDKLWGNQANEVNVFPVSEAFRKGLIKTAPRNDEEFRELSKKVTEELLEKNKKRIMKIKEKKKGVFVLRYYQKEAIDSWFTKGKSGIFAMATGTGKTITALACVDRLKKEEEKLGIIIVTPQNTITNQWVERNLKDFNFHGEEVYGCSKRNLDRLANKILDLNNDNISYFIIGTTYDTFCKDKFIEQINKCEAPLLLIADEVHSVATPERNKGLLNIYDYRLGLSATPKRYFDDEGTNLIYDYFYKSNYNEKEGDTYIFDIGRAIQEKNPDTGKTYLTSYDYHPYLCELTSNEFFEFEEYTKKIGREYHLAKKTGDYRRYNLLLNRRKDIIKNANNKIRVCKRILKDIQVIKNCLFFLDTEEQIRKLKDMIDKEFPYIIYKTFTTKSFQGKKDLKFKYLEEFSNGDYDVLLSIDCFSEGLDVPSIKIAIFIASSTNPKEFIQRRGRVLRNYPGKEKAVIYDIVVIPPIKTSNISREELKLAKSLLIPELKRYKVFTADSSNKIDNFEMVEDILNRYQIDFSKL